MLRNIITDTISMRKTHVLMVHLPLQHFNRQIVPVSGTWENNGHAPSGVYLHVYISHLVILNILMSCNIVEHSTCGRPSKRVRAIGQTSVLEKRQAAPRGAPTAGALGILVKPTPPYSCEIAATAL